jgi:predicted nucleic acid-binding protein
MKNIFVDTNIIIDLLANRFPHSKYAIEIFASAELSNIKLFTSSHSIATTYYILRKHLDEKELRETLYNLVGRLNVIAVDDSILRRGLRSRYKDFEDSIQILCALNVEKMDYIITRNIKDFKDCEIPVLTPDELCLSILHI